MKRSLSGLLENILSQLQLNNYPELPPKILTYLDLLERWNRAYNLTAILDPYDRMTKHIADSLAVSPYLVGQNWLDVGSGAGLPGIPLALLFPNRKWTLIDSNAKKTWFLVQVKAVLGLENVTVVQSAVENYMPAHCFDGVITRAWTDLSDMVVKTRHLYCKNSYLWAMKGVYPSEELSVISQPYEVYRLEVPNLAEQRHLVRITMESV